MPSYLKNARMTVTFIVTKACNFRCHYCYMVRKNDHSRMSLDVAKKAIDYLLQDHMRFPQKGVVWEFIGGEPFLEVDLIGQICDYVTLRTWELGHPWFDDSTFSVSSNGSLYGRPEVQALLDRHEGRFSVGLTIDGPAHVHDLERVLTNGEGTHHLVVKNIPLWLKRTLEPATKVTISPSNLPYLAESILYLFSLGIPLVHSNVVFENVWEPGDEDVFEEQLDILGNAIIDQELWIKHECSFFSRHIGIRRTRASGEEDANWCGTGRYMIAVDAQGLFYPCVRFTDHSLRSQPPLIIGDIEKGVLTSKLQPFYNLTCSGQSSKECLECPISAGCAWCAGFNYDDSGTIYRRATYICKMHKARVRANHRFWQRFDGEGHGEKLRKSNA